MFKFYFINFWYWWYFVLGRRQASYLVDRFIFLLQYTNTLPMAQNINTPMFQDDSGVGKGISLVIRVLWVWFGGMMTVVLMIPFFIRLVAILFLPVSTLFFLVLAIGGLLR